MCCLRQCFYTVIWITANEVGQSSNLHFCKPGYLYMQSVLLLTSGEWDVQCYSLMCMYSSRTSTCICIDLGQCFYSECDLWRICMSLKPPSSHPSWKVMLIWDKYQFLALAILSSKVYCISTLGTWVGSVYQDLVRTGTIFWFGTNMVRYARYEVVCTGTAYHAFEWCIHVVFWLEVSLSSCRVNGFL